MTGHFEAVSANGHVLDELTGLASRLAPPSTLAALKDARERAATRSFNVVVLGEFKRGKSTLINALLGRTLLPTGVVPLTASVTIVRPGDRDRVLLRFENGAAEEVALDHLPRYVTERENPHNSHGIAHVTVEARSGLIGSGIQLVDTPGTASVHEHNTEATYRFLAHVDAALCVLGADQPLTSGERDFLAEAVAGIPRVIVAVNRIDTLLESERQEALEFLSGALTTVLGQPPELFPLSALSGEGVDDLRERLHRLARDDGDAILRETLRRAAQRTAVETVQASRLEVAAVRLPIDQLEARSALFEQKLEELLRTRRDASDLLERGLERLLREQVQTPLGELAAQRADELRSEVRDQAAMLPPRPRAAFAEGLENWVDSTIHEAFADLSAAYEQRVADGIAELEQVHAQRISGILAELHSAAQEILGATAVAAMPELGLTAPSRFSFKLRDVRHALEQIVVVGRTTAPGKLGRNLLVREAERRVIQMFDRHAGRLRSELTERARAAVREYDRGLQRIVVEAADAVRAAIARARAEHDQGEEAIRARVLELEGVAVRAIELERLFTSSSEWSSAA